MDRLAKANKFMTDAFEERRAAERLGKLGSNHAREHVFRLTEIIALARSAATLAGMDAPGIRSEAGNLEHWARERLCALVCD